MSVNPFRIKPIRIKPIRIAPIDIWGSQSSRRTLGIRDRQILYERAKGRCECCGKKISFSEMQVGHRKAYSKGGATTLANAACLCYKCNKLQGTDSLETLKKKLNGTYGKKKTEEEKPTKRKKTRRETSSFTWVNPFTGKREKLFDPPDIF